MHAKVKPFPEEQTLAATRQQYRSEFISERYSGHLHLLFTCSVSALLIGVCAWNLQAVSLLEWLTVPLTFVYANFSEWAGHRFVMHRPVKFLGLVYKRHSLQHHRFFTDRHMEIDSARDYKAVLFPPVLVSFFLLAFFLPLALAMNALFSSNAALLFTITGMAYFLNYELLHLSYHLKADHWVHRLPGHATLARLHTTHHDMRVMAHKNFNISYPITDWIMKTWDRR